MVAAVEQSFPQHEIERRAFEHQRAVEDGRRIVVGQNAYGDQAGTDGPPLHRQDPALEAAQTARVARFRAGRDAGAAASTLAALGSAARGTGNLLPHILTAVKARATLGEIADCLRDAFGEYHAPA
jgi:methylmalonyl-CoA mutase N-terminal domain/subunit